MKTYKVSAISQIQVYKHSKTINTMGCSLR